MTLQEFLGMSKINLSSLDIDVRDKRADLVRRYYFRYHTQTLQSVLKDEPLPIEYIDSDIFKQETNYKDILGIVPSELHDIDVLCFGMFGRGELWVSLQIEE